MTTSIQIGLRHQSTLEIIAFRLQAQEFCVRTTAIREIRGWVPVTPLPQSPPEVIGVMNLRGKVIPIIDLALKLGMKGAQPNERSAVVVTEAGGLVIGLLVDGVSDILTLPADLLQPIPSVESSQASVHAEGIIAHEGKMICFLNLDRMFGAASEEARTAA
jgi:purine-binding chemotaxis protein CheW